MSHKAAILEMFEQRKYTDIVDNDSNITAYDKDGNTVYAFTNVIQKLNVKEIQSHIVFLQENKIDHGIIVYNGNPTPVVKTVIANTSELGLTIELFHIVDLQFNPTKHQLVPEHILLTQDELRKFKQIFDVKNLPIIKSDDVIARWYNYKKGDVVKCEDRYLLVK